MPSRSAVSTASPSVSLTAALAVERLAPVTAVPVLVLIAANVVPTGPTWPELSTSGVTPTDSAARFVKWRAWTIASLRALTTAWLPAAEASEVPTPVSATPIAPTVPSAVAPPVQSVRAGKAGTTARMALSLATISLMASLTVTRAVSKPAF